MESDRTLTTLHEIWRTAMLAEAHSEARTDIKPGMIVLDHGRECIVLSIAYPIRVFYIDGKIIERRDLGVAFVEYPDGFVDCPDVASLEVAHG